MLACAARQDAETASGRADVAIDQERHRYHAQAEHDPAEDRADDRTADDQRPSARGQEDHLQELRDRGRRRPVEQSDIEHAGGDQPDEEDQQQQARHDAHVVDGRALADVEEVEPVKVLLASFAAPRQLVETDGGHGPEQPHAGHDREEEWHQRHARREDDRCDSDHRIDDPREHDVAAEGQEIVKALPQRNAEILHANLANGNFRGLTRRAASDGIGRHDTSSRTVPSGAKDAGRLDPLSTGRPVGQVV